MTAALALLGVVAALLLTGMALSRITRPQHDDASGEQTLIDAVNAVLPQTQCAQCGYPGCRPYAEAVVKNNEAINRCPPGGDATIAQLADMLGATVIPLNTDCGEEKPEQIAVIDEAVCIGCTLCIVACPVDAIVGAAKQMHTVIAQDCTGCELCIPPCPVDCIDLVAPVRTPANWHWPKPD